MNKLGIIHPSDNTQVDIQRDVNGGALTVIRQPKMTTHFRVSRENAIGMGIAYLEAAGVPIPAQVPQYLADVNQCIATEPGGSASPRRSPRSTDFPSTYISNSSPLATAT